MPKKKNYKQSKKNQITWGKYFQLMSQTKQWIISLIWKELLKIGKKIISNPTEKVAKNINRHFIEK